MPLIKNFVLNPDQYLIPNYLISPFTNNDLIKNTNIVKSQICKKYLDKRFSSKKYIYTNSGREAINIALNHFNLKPKDYVTIFTTSQNKYISSCVTNEIEKFCKWSRKIEKNTKIIFINHEFGYPYKEIKKIKKYNIPIIEDYAHSFFLKENSKIESDFAIYSLPKMFPIQIGGLLVSNQNLKIKSKVNKQTKKYIESVLSKNLIIKNEIIKKRLENFKYLKSKLTKIGMKPFFPEIKNIVPGVFMFQILPKINLNEFKEYMNSHGIQSSVFYGKNAYFIPIHQNLSTMDLNYFYEVIKSFFKK